MSTSIIYKGNTVTTVKNQTIVLDVKGTWLEDDITLADTDSYHGEVMYLYQDTDGYIHTSDTFPTDPFIKVMEVLVMNVFTPGTLVDSSNNPFVDSNGDTFMAVMAE